ncbi:MAG: hypothetical protein R3A44_20435 [Caldilineaceae bacterium]
MMQTAGLLWTGPVTVSQQALSERLRTLPAALFERILQDVLPKMQSKWQARSRPMPPEIAWALQHYARVWAVDGSTLDALMRRVGLLRDLPDHPLAGRMMGLLDVASRLPIQLWYTEDEQAMTNDSGSRFWRPCYLAPSSCWIWDSPTTLTMFA